MKVLVFGGSRFFGKKLISLLVEAGDEVTMATRGQTSDPFGDRIHRVQVDRQRREDLERIAAEQEWDIIYDNIGFASQDALDAVEVFAGKTKRYIFTSSLSVYEQGSDQLTEEEVDPLNYPVTIGTYQQFDYAEGKRQAEAVLLQRASFPVATVRIPFVVGEDDYTERLLFHVRSVMQGKPVQALAPEARIAYIHSDEAAKFLFWLGRNSLTGPVNACATGTLSLQEIMNLTERQVGKPAVIEITNSPEKAENLSPYAVGGSYGMSTAKASTAGFTFSLIEDWFPSLIQQLHRALL